MFTGGKHMYDAKASLAEECCFLPCGVEYDHFSKNVKVRPEKLKEISAPIAGYFGAIDERLDLELLIYLSETCKDVNFIFMGPILKIDYSQLFERDNVHYLGEIDYSELPNYGSFMDVCLIPFAITELTKTMNLKTIGRFIKKKRPNVLFRWKIHSQESYQNECRRPSRILPGAHRT